MSMSEIVYIDRIIYSKYTVCKYLFLVLPDTITSSALAGISRMGSRVREGREAEGGVGWVEKGRRREEWEGRRGKVRERRVG